jgi:hypothetical protein
MCPPGSIGAVNKICNEWRRLPSRPQHAVIPNKSDAIWNENGRNRSQQLHAATPCMRAYLSLCKVGMARELLHRALCMLGQLTTCVQHVHLLEMYVQGIAETFGGVSGKQAAVNMVTVSAHGPGKLKSCAMTYHAVRTACLQPIYSSCTHMCGCIADDMRSALQRTKPKVWHEIGSSSHMAFFLQLNFLVCCCNVSGFDFVLLPSWHTATDSQSCKFHDKLLLMLLY